MSICVNRVFLAGNLTRDPVLRTVGSGNEVANLGLALNRRYRTRDGEQRDETTFVDCEAWGKTAQLIGQYLMKGSPAMIEGRLKLDQWQDEHGQNRNRLRVVIDRISFLPDPRRQGDRPAEKSRIVEERGYAYTPGADGEPLF